MEGGAGSRLTRLTKNGGHPVASWNQRRAIVDQELRTDCLLVHKMTNQQVSHSLATLGKNHESCSDYGFRRLRASENGGRFSILI